VYKQTSILSVEIEQVQIDILTLARSIKRRPRADLIDEIQKELDIIDKSIMTEDTMPDYLVNLEHNFDFKKYLPEILAEWDLEFRKLHANEMINVPDFDLRQFDEPFTKNHKAEAENFQIDDS
jgi:hypothetical protein